MHNLYPRPLPTAYPRCSNPSRSPPITPATALVRVLIFAYFAARLERCLPLLSPLVLAAPPVPRDVRPIILEYVEDIYARDCPVFNFNHGIRVLFCFVGLRMDEWGRGQSEARRELHGAPFLFHVDRISSLYESYPFDIHV